MGVASRVALKRDGLGQAPGRVQDEPDAPPPTQRESVAWDAREEGLSAVLTAQGIQGGCNVTGALVPRDTMAARGWAQIVTQELLTPQGEDVTSEEACRMVRDVIGCDGVHGRAVGVVQPTACQVVRTEDHCLPES